MGFLLDDPKQTGLLSLGLRLMSTPGRFTSALGQAGMGALGDYQAAAQQQKQNKRADLQESIMLMQLAQAQRKAEAQREAEAKRAGFLNSIDQNAGPAMPFSPAAAMGAGLGADEIKALQNEEPRPMVVGPGSVVLDPKTQQPLFKAPFKPETPSLNDLIVPGPDGKPIVNQALLDAKKQIAASAPGVQVSYGAPLPALNPKTNEVELARPDNRGGINFTGIKPAPQDRDVKLPAELQRMQIAGDAMVKLMDDYESMLRRHNPRDPVTQMSPTVRADMQALKRNIELQFKELQALGALAGPDIEIMRQSLSDPFSFQGAYFGRDGLLAQVRRARELVKTRADAVVRSQGRPVKSDAASPAASDPLGIRGR